MLHFPLELDDDGLVAGGEDTLEARLLIDPRPQHVSTLKYGRVVGPSEYLAPGSGSIFFQLSEFCRQELSKNREFEIFEI